MTSSQTGWLYYAVSDREISDRDDLDDRVSVKKDNPLTLELEVSGGEDASPGFYYYLMNEGGECSKLQTMPVPAYTYPITIASSDRGVVRVYWNGELLQSGDRVINGETVTISAEPYDGYVLTVILVDGEEIDGTSLQVTGAHTVSAVFIKKDVATAGGFASGSGTQADPYLIGDTSELKYFALRVNSGDSMAGKYVALDADLDLEGAVFTPIGTSNLTPFAGTFDGQGHTLLNLNIALEGTFYGGLFGYLTGTVENMYRGVEPKQTNLSVLRRKEELRLQMTEEAADTMLKLGVEADIDAIKDRIEGMKQQEQEYFRQMLTAEGSEPTEAAVLFGWV